jgi:hypothetical protein
LKGTNNIIKMTSVPALVISWIILLFHYLTISSAEVFTIPTTTPFLLKSKLYKSELHPAIISVIRGGSDNGVPVYEEEEDTEETVDETIVEEEEEEGEANEEWEEDQYDEEAITQDFGEEEEIEESSFAVQADFVQIDPEEIFDDEEEEDFVVDVQEEVFDDEQAEDQDEDQAEEETFHDALEELPADEPAPLTQVLEERMPTNTDDESSAFVDRMDLADAYDEGETTTGGGESAALAAVSAAKVSGGGGDDDDDPKEEKTAEKATVTEAVITDEMAAILRKDLKYTAQDVKLMRPDIAAIVLAKSLRRPFEGMPPNFYIDGKAPSNGLRRAIVRATLTIAAVGAVAILGLNGDLDFAKGAAKPFALLAAVPSKPQSAVSKPKKETTAVKAPKETVTSIPIVSSSTDESPSVDGDGEDEKDTEDDHPHSVKPYASHAPAFEEDLDKTWLDKVISKIENAIKAILRIEI